MRGVRIWAAILSCTLLAGCAGTGLPRGREIGDMDLPRVMGVDVQADGNCAVTIAAGSRALGNQEETANEEHSLLLTASRTTLAGACQAMQNLADRHIFFGYVDQLLLGEDLADQGVRMTLEYVARDAELGLGARVWLVRGGTAQKALELAGENAASRLTTLGADSDAGTPPMTATVEKILSALLEDGAAWAPALVAADVPGQTALPENGYGVLTSDGLAGWLTGEAARGLELLGGETATGLTEVPCASGTSVVRITGISMTMTPKETNGELTGITLDYQLRARPIQFGTEESREELSASLAELERARMEQTLACLQCWKTDCLSLGRKLALIAPNLYRAQQADWPQTFSRLQFDICVEVELQDR